MDDASCMDSHFECRIGSVKTFCRLGNFCLPRLPQVRASPESQAGARDQAPWLECDRGLEALTDSSGV